MDSKDLKKIETLRKIDFLNLEQFCEDINRNFAVIQNSPLFKGIPGEPGNPGNPGNPGVRGSQFFFVKLSNFTPNFPGELKTGSDITLEFINTKLTTFESKQKLLSSIGASELVNGDVVVLTNSVMLSYSSSAEIFVNTNIAFNEQSNIISSIEEKIDEIVDEKISNNPTINSLKNIFVDYETVGKQYADNDNSYVTRRLSNTKSSIGLSPYIPGKNNNIGVAKDLLNHEYFGYSTNEMPDTSKSGTLVLGSMPVYIDLFNKTLTTSSQKTFTTKYVPTNESIPTLILLQDTYNNGLMFGYKNSKSLKDFGSIYKNESGYLCIKSDMGDIESEYGLLQINFQNLLFNKNFRLTGDAILNRNVEIAGELSQRFFRTSKYTDGANKDTIEIGQTPFVENSRCFNTSDIQYFKPYSGKVFVLDDDGKVLKNYTIEKSEVDTANESDLNEFTTFPDDKNTIVTSNYIAILFRKTVKMCQYIKKNYWRKDQFATGDIPELKISGNITTTKNFINDAFKTNVDSNNVEMCTKDGEWTYKNGASTINFSKFTGKVLVTDESGNLLQTYSIDKTQLKDEELIDNVQITSVPSSENTIVTGNFIKWIATKINNFMSYVNKTYWTKNDFITGDIPELKLKKLSVSGDFFTPQINASESTNTVTVGKDSSSNVKINGTLNFSKYNNVVLVTDNDGTILNSYSIERNYIPDNELPGFNMMTETSITSENKLLSSKSLNQIIIKINNVIKYIKNSYWDKDSFENNVIPNLKVSGTLTAADSIVIGANPETAAFTSDRVKNNTTIGTTQTIIKSTDIQFSNFANKVIVCDSNGRVSTTYEIEKSEVDTNLLYDVPQNYGAPAKQPSVYPNSTSKILTSNYWDLLHRTIYNIKLRLNITPNKTDVVSYLYKHLPVGSIMMWSKKSIDLLKLNYPDSYQSLLESDGYTPKGWVVCDGRNIPGSSLQTFDYRNKYLKVADIESTDADTEGGSDKLKISAKNLPYHKHAINISFKVNDSHTHEISGGEHVHYFWKGQDGSARGGNGYDNAPYSYTDYNHDKRALRVTSPDYNKRDWDNRGWDGSNPGGGPGIDTGHTHECGPAKNNSTVRVNDYTLATIYDYWDKAVGGTNYGEEFDNSPKYGTIFLIMKYKTSESDY